MDFLDSLRRNVNSLPSSGLALGFIQVHSGSELIGAGSSFPRNKDCRRKRVTTVLDSVQMLRNCGSSYAVISVN
jgi:hypothetical protein